MAFLTFQQTIGTLEHVDPMMHVVSHYNETYVILGT
jgi:hypothetical protein